MRICMYTSQVHHIDVYLSNMNMIIHIFCLIVNVFDNQTYTRDTIINDMISKMFLHNIWHARGHRGRPKTKQ